MPRMDCLIIALASFLALASCSKETTTTVPAASEQVRTRGSLEVTAKLLPFPADAIVKRDLYKYATILKYQVVTVHRGEIKTNTIYIAHYNPHLPRYEAADKLVANTGGNLAAFVPGDVHRMALVPKDDPDGYMGAEINSFIEENPDPIYFAVWTDRG